MSSSSQVIESWIASFCNVLGHEYFAEVSEDFIEDDFNLTGLSSQVPMYKEALEMILDVEPDDEDSDEDILDEDEEDDEFGLDPDGNPSAQRRAAASAASSGAPRAASSETTSPIRAARPPAPAPAPAPPRRQRHHDSAALSAEGVLLASTPHEDALGSTPPPVLPRAFSLLV